MSPAKFRTVSQDYRAQDGVSGLFSSSIESDIKLKRFLLATIHCTAVNAEGAVDLPVLSTVRDEVASFPFIKDEILRSRGAVQLYSEGVLFGRPDLFRRLQI